MAEPPKTPTNGATRVCRTCNKNIVVKNHPLDLFGVKASQENIPLVLERFFELKVAFNDAWSPVIYLCRCCHHEVMKFEEFFRKSRFRGNNKSQFTRQKGKNNSTESIGNIPTKETWPKEEKNLRRRTCKSSGRSLFHMHVDKPSKTPENCWHLGHTDVDWKHNPPDCWDNHAMPAFKKWN